MRWPAQGATVACLGLAFKADVDDLRESPAVEVTRELALARPDLTLLAVEPHVQRLPEQLATGPVVLTGLDEALARSDVVLLLVDHAEFKASAGHASPARRSSTPAGCGGATR